MAVYTMQLRTYIEKFTQNRPDLSLEERIEIGREKLFDFDYPFFSENYRKQFELNIINEFYMREIGFETEGLFKMRLKHWLFKYMPYYNKLFESERIKYDPLINTQMKLTHIKKNDKEQNDLRNIDQLSNTKGQGNTESEQTGNVDTKQNTKSNTEKNTNEDSFRRNIESDTPQDRLRLSTKDGSGIIEYASKIYEDKDDKQTNEKGNTTQDVDGKRTDKTNFKSNDVTNVDSLAEQKDTFKGETNELENFSQHRTGKVGSQSYSKMIQEYRESLLRIEEQIHDEMQELFMLVY